MTISQTSLRNRETVLGLKMVLEKALNNYNIVFAKRISNTTDTIFTLLKELNNALDILSKIRQY